MRVTLKRGYPATRFRQMRSSRNADLVEIITGLVESGAIQSGFHALKKKDLLKWSIEQGVVNFPERFRTRTVECAQFRLDNAGDRTLRSG